MKDFGSSKVSAKQSELEQVEKDLRMKLVDFSHRPEIQAQIGEAFYVWKNDPETLNDYMSEEDIDDLTFAKFFDWFIYDFKSFDTEKRMIEQFYDEEKENLSNTERSLIYEWLDSLHSFFEIEEVFPTEEGFRIRDIFTGEVHQLTDSASSKQVTSSEIISGRPIRVGGKTYFSGVISVYPQAFKPVIFDFFNREFSEYRKAFGRKRTLKEYLRDWGFLIENYIEDIIKNPRFLNPEGDEFALASATYSLNDQEEVLRRLKEIKNVQEMDGGTEELRIFSWARKDKSGISGTIEIEGEKLVIQCYSQDSLANGKQLLQDNLGALITHEEDYVKQLASFLEARIRRKEKHGKLPPGVKRRSELDSALDEYYDEWIDKPHESLQDKTPRQALETKGGREKLKSILNELEIFYEGARERGEPYYNVEKLNKKLKLKRS